MAGMGLTPFLWYCSQHESFDAPGSPRGGLGRAPWGDEVLRKWGAHLGVGDALERYVGCGDQATVRQRFLTYSATILSFVGAIHWGAAACAPTPFAATQFAVSVLPALVGWAALNVDRGAATGAQRSTSPHSLLALAFLATHFFDEAAAVRKPVAAVPAWFTHLRTPLSTTVVLTHCLAAYAARELSLADRQD